MNPFIWLLNQHRKLCGTYPTRLDGAKLYVHRDESYEPNVRFNEPALQQHLHHFFVNYEH